MPSKMCLHEDVKPGYMRELLPEDPPEEGEAWDKIFKDVEGVIMPGVTNFSFGNTFSVKIIRLLI